MLWLRIFKQPKNNPTMKVMKPNIKRLLSVVFRNRAILYEACVNAVKTIII